MSTSSNKGQVVVLVADGFDELFLSECLHQFNQAELWVQLVGLTTGVLCGQNGLEVRPDLSLSQIAAKGYPAGRLLVVSSGKQCTGSLMVDPRVHELITATLESGGYVASPASLLKEFLTATGTLSLSNLGQLLTAGQEAQSTFLARLVTIAGQPPSPPSLS